MSLLQFKQDLAPEKDFMKEWADASEFYISMRSKEANLKALGKDIGLGAGIGASIGAIRATGTKDPNETVGGKLKRIGTEAVDKAVDGTVQGLAVNGIRRMGAMRDAARGISKLSSWNNVIPKAKELGNTIYQGAKSTIKPIATDVGDRLATSAVKNPEALGAIGGATLGAYGNEGGVIGAAGGALAGGLVGKHYGPGLLHSAMDKNSPLLGKAVRSKLISKIALNMSVANGLKGFGKTLAGSKAAIPLGTATVGYGVDKMNGGSGLTGAAAGAGLGLAGRTGILRNIASKKNPLLGKSVGSGARVEMNAAAKAAKPTGAMASPTATGSTVANATPKINPATAPTKPMVTPGAKAAVTPPVQAEPPSLQQLAREATPQAPNMARPQAPIAATSKSPTLPAPSVSGGTVTGGQTINGIKTPESVNFTGSEISDLNLSGVPKPSMTDRIKGSLGNAKARVQAEYNNRFNKVNWNDPKMNNTLQLVETAQNNPKALAGIVNNLDQKTVNQLVRMGVI